MTGMSREAAHAAIVLILSDVPAGYRFTDIADDILDTIWPEDAHTDDGPYPDGITFEKPILNTQGIVIGYGEMTLHPDDITADRTEPP